MSELNQPSRDPANDDSLIGTFRQVLDKFLLGVDDMIPARVVAFDREANRAQVQPLVMLLTTSGQTVQRAQVASVPVVQIGGGGFVLNFPLKPGDFGYLKANDRDISLVMQSGNIAAPNTVRKHSFEDAVFIPVVDRDFTVSDIDAAVLQNKDGTVGISIFEDKIEMKVGAGIITIDGDQITTNMKIVSPEMTFNGINATTHVHSGVQTGVNNTGVPV